MASAALLSAQMPAKAETSPNNAEYLRTFHVCMATSQGVRDNFKREIFLKVRATGKDTPEIRALQREYTSGESAAILACKNRANQALREAEETSLGG